jgi:SOS response regulatory protein OraA/RecX
MAEGMADVERRRDPLDVAVRALRHRDRASADVDARLERAGIGEEERRATIESLERLGYIDDARFAETRARALAGREQGDQAIRFDLERQGVGADELEQALASLTPEQERAEAIVAARGGGATTARYLARKGFGEDGIAVAVAQEP